MRTYLPFMLKIQLRPSNHHASPFLSVHHEPCSCFSSTKFQLFCHQSPIFISLTLSTSSSPSRDKQLTFSMTHSTLISTKYFTVPFFQAVNLISEGISHLAIIFWTIKPISEEQRLSGELYRPNYVRPFVSMSNTLFKWAIVVRAIVIHWHIISRSF